MPIRPAVVRRNLQTRLLLPLISLVALTNACAPKPPASPMCRVDSRFEEEISANAGCIIRVNDKLLTVTHKHSGKLDIPGGTSTGTENAQCTAHRETWEETGFNVEVGILLGENENGFRYYDCQLAGNFVGDITEFPVPQWSQSEVRAISLHDPYLLNDSQWRFTNRLVNLRDMFNHASTPPP